MKIDGKDVVNPNAVPPPAKQPASGVTTSPAVSDAIVQYNSTGERIGVGSITVVHGEFFVDGKPISLEELFYQLQVAHMTNTDNALADRLKELQSRNDETKQYNSLLEELRAIMPKDSDGTVKPTDVPSGATTSFSQWKKSFENKYGYDITAKMEFNFPSDGANQTQVTQWVESVKSKISTLNSDNQITQLQIERLNNQRNEILQGLSTFNKSSAETMTSIVRNF